MIGGHISCGRKISDRIKLAGGIKCHGCDRVIHPRNAPHADPIGIAQGGVNTHGVSGSGGGHAHKQFVVARGFHPRREFFAGGIRHFQSAVGNLPTALVELQLRAGGCGFHLGAGHGQLNAKFARRSGLTHYHKVLPHAVHTDSVFLNQTGACVLHSLPGGGNSAGGAQGCVAHGDGFDLKVVGGLVGDGGGQPQAGRRGFAIQPLKDAVQERAGAGGGDAQAITVIIGTGFGAELVPGNGRGSILRAGNYGR